MQKDRLFRKKYDVLITLNPLVYLAITGRNNTPQEEITLQI